MAEDKKVELKEDALLATCREMMKHRMLSAAEEAERLRATERHVCDSCKAEDQFETVDSDTVRCKACKVITARYLDVHEQLCLAEKTIEEMALEDESTYACRACGHVGADFNEVHYFEGDSDLMCPKCESTQVSEVPEALSTLVNELDTQQAENEKLRERIAELEKSEETLIAEGKKEIESLRTATQTSWADMAEAGRLCGMRDNEYPLKAVQRVVSELDAAWKAAAVPVRGMVELAEVITDLRTKRDEAHSKNDQLERAYQKLRDALTETSNLQVKAVHERDEMQARAKHWSDEFNNAMKLFNLAGSQRDSAKAEIERLKKGSDEAHQLMSDGTQQLLLLRRTVRTLNDALKELVELKDDVKHRDPVAYEQRRPKAWQAAREALAGLPDERDSLPPMASKPGEVGCSAVHDGWVCTRLKGHEGEHIACCLDEHGKVDEICDRWPQEEHCSPEPAKCEACPAEDECIEAGTLIEKKPVEG